MSNTKILSFGGSPTFEYVEANVAAMSTVGFDGYILTPTYADNTLELGWNLWGSTELPTVDPLWDGVTPPSENRRHNFLRANVTPGNIDWFDTAGMTVVKENYVNYALLARESYCKGLFFDNEAYDGQLWQYSAQPEAGSHTLSEYKVQVKAFATALGLELWSVFPSCLFILAFGYQAAIDEGGPEEDKQYGLLPSFLDGLLDSMADFPCTECIMGNELTYSCKTEGCFQNAVDKSNQGVYQGGSDQFVTHARIAMATNVTNAPFDNEDTSGNYFTPGGLTATLVLASNYTDRYLWVYSGAYGWSEPVIPPGEFVSDLLSTDYSESIINALNLVE